MKKNVIALSIVGAMSIPALANAVQVAGEELEVYAKAHMSLDMSDPDNTAVDSQTSISSNDSYIGFKGKHKMENGMNALFQLEQQVNFDETGGTFATRNSFAGLEGGFGTVLVGHHDTPFRDVAKKFDLFNETVGDRRAILGAGATNGNKMNDRGENMIMYKNKFGATEFQFQHSFSNPTASVGGALDDNENDMTSLGLFYSEGPLSVAGGYETWSDLLNNDSSEVSGIRLMGSYVFGKAKVGAIYESTSSDDSAQWERDAYGFNGSLDLGNDTALNLQVLMADDYDGTSESGATMTTFGVSKKLEKKTEVYAVYTTTSNDDNAQYQGIDGGHGDEMTTVLGGNPNALSIGFMHSI